MKCPIIKCKNPIYQNRKYCESCEKVIKKMSYIFHKIHEFDRRYFHKRRNKNFETGKKCFTITYGYGMVNREIIIFFNKNGQMFLKDCNIYFSKKINNEFVGYLKDVDKKFNQYKL